MDGDIAAGAAIITVGVEVTATTTVGGTIAIGGDLTSVILKRPPALAASFIDGIGKGRRISDARSYLRYRLCRGASGSCDNEGGCRVCSACWRLRCRSSNRRLISRERSDNITTVLRCLLDFSVHAFDP
jgi:hypothetical protein